jgi:hypothetical protein
MGFFCDILYFLCSQKKFHRLPILMRFLNLLIILHFGKLPLCEGDGYLDPGGLLTQCFVAPSVKTGGNMGT